ncbi:hypothetical protein Q9Q94_16360 [Uliginosibacterium sp. 31-16]|uniref:hypothetical protein n=1 Tax=Uliginosibacterium sp. 31-16 TaxID=3068315 RepID=UPI00273F2DED|nr:hypothetical protein [Uliginosibacterium sp. 31-16]MDP5241116.1 hypothetical protein [Uliginosibacterium sp. 31-16]
MHQLINAGWAGVIGMALVMFATAFDFSGNRDRKAELAGITSQRAELAMQLRSGTQSEASPREILARFYQGFPAANNLPEILLQLDASARKQGLAPRRADYGDSAENGIELNGEARDSIRGADTRRVRISMPVKGSYSALRAWLIDALETVPTLSIEAIELQRPNIQQTELDAQVRLVVYLRGTQ